MMFTLNDNSNKHKVTYYIALVILLVTLGQFVDATEVISHSSPKSISTDVSVIRGNDVGLKSIPKKLTEVRQLLRSLIFDWNLGESGNEIIGRTFGRIRMMKNILLPVAFIGGFLTAVIFSIKAIGVINFFLISSLVVLNLAVIVGKLIYAKKLGHGASQTHYHSHFNQQLPSYPSHPPYGTYGSYGSNLGSYSSSYGYADNRIDERLPFERNLKLQTPILPTGPQAFHRIGRQDSRFSPQSNFPISQIGSESPQSNSFNSGFTPQSNQIQSFQNQASPNFNQNPTTLNSLHQPQSPPTNFQTQINTKPQNINNNQFSGIPQQVQQQQPTSNTFNQPLNQLFSQMQDMNFLNNDIVTTVPTFEITTTPSSGLDFEMINFQEIKPQSSFSPLEMENILTNALARISESKRGVPATSLPNVLRFKRKSTNHQPYLNLLRPFS